MAYPPSFGGLAIFLTHKYPLSYTLPIKKQAPITLGIIQNSADMLIFRVRAGRGEANLSRVRST
jgi:hypothetical protein